MRFRLAAELCARLLSEPLDNRGWELRCYLQDSDGYIIEVGQAGEKMLDFSEDFGG